MRPAEFIITAIVLSALLWQNAFLKDQLEAQRKATVLINQELHLLNEQLLGINRNLKHLGVFYNVKPKGDK
jgi:hypothetical protein